MYGFIRVGIEVGTDYSGTVTLKALDNGRANILRAAGDNYDSRCGHQSFSAVA
jgi:hypothetical protein